MRLPRSGEQLRCVNIWDLPGPSSFVDDIEAAVREGSSVILRFPSEVPDGLERELKERLQSIFEWTRIDAACPDLDPLTLLCQRACPDIGVSDARSMAELAVTASFQGRLVWVDKIDRGAWSEWSTILRAYSDASRNVDLLSRTVFIVLLTGEVVVDEAPEEVALVCCDFRGVVNALDLFAFSLWRTPSNILRGEHRALLAHTVAQVAQWDCVLAEQILGLPLNEALNPAGILQQYARDRGWTAETPRCWEMGTVDGPAERPIVHSALLEVSGVSRLVRQRVWAAQAAVLLPLVEERRVGLVARYGRYLNLPIKTEAGRRIDDPLDLDVGQLAWYLDRTGKPQVLRKQLRRLRHFRNKLAHMEPLEPEQALHRMLVVDP